MRCTVISVSEMSGTLTVQLILGEEVSTIVVTGDMDIATAGSIASQAQPVFAATGAPVVEVNLAGVGFCDSAGISALVQLRKMADRSGHELRVVHAREAVWRVLDYSGLREYLHVE